MVSPRSQIASLVERDHTIDMTVVNQTAKMSLKWAKQSLPVVMQYLEAANGEVPPTPSGPTTAMPPTLPPEPTPSASFRLPGDVMPTDYQLKIVPYLSGDKRGTFEGEVTIKINVLQRTSHLYVHANGLSFEDKDISIVDEAQTPVKISYAFNSELYEWYSISTDMNLQAGKSYTVKIAYTGKFSDDLKGFHLTSASGTSGPM